jgi:hypothetical protein
LRRTAASRRIAHFLEHLRLDDLALFGDESRDGFRFFGQ